jgi:anthranilate phosphoribosyltransferase
MQEPDKIRAFLKKVGRGKTLSRDLTREEAREAVASLLRGEFTPAQTGAFLQALRIKETSVDELVGAAEVFGRARFQCSPPVRNTPWW